MANPLLEIGTILPPLLEQQISPPYRIIMRHLNYLQKWREYLLWVWTDDLDDNTNRANIQQSVDELISTILLIDFVGRSYPTAIPTIEQILKIVRRPTAFSLCEVVYNQISCKLLKAIFNPNHWNISMMEPKKDIEFSSLADISESIETTYSSRMPITLLGDFYQLCLDRPVADKTIHKKASDRHGKGVYYTPAPLVDYLVFHTLKNVFCKLEPKQIHHLRVLDPSCGCGVFLIATARFILRWLKDKYTNNKEWPRFCLQKSLELFESMIYGTDIDERAIHWARRLLLLTVWDFYINNNISKNDIRDLRIPIFDKNIVCKDFLDDRSLKNDTFNVIVGGPPFVRVQELYKSDPEKVDNYKCNFKTAKNGQFDLYMLFIEKAIELLVDQGYLSMSVSNTFLRSESGRTLRKLIAEKCTVNEIVEFEDSKLYPNALVQIAAITLQKTIAGNTTKHVFVKGRGGLRRKLSRIDKHDDNTFLQTRSLPVAACASENWNLRSESEVNLLHKIESIGIPLGELPIRICFGAATGADKIFMLRNSDYLNSKTMLAESRFLDDVFVFESTILRPILRGRNVKGYTTPESETLCIFPYDETGKLLTENVLQTNFPFTYKYLKSCQSYLGSRKLKAGQSWYSFRNESISQFIQCPKIVASVVSSGRGFALDQHQHLFCNNSVILIYPDENIINSYFLLAVLNSNVFWTWAQHRMPTLGLGWRSYRVSIFRKFPIPVPLDDKDNQLFESVINLAGKLLKTKPNNQDRASILSAIDNKVCELYGISQSELIIGSNSSDANG
ncbi:MAG: N-6 DNA methylase [Planctomycetes bacterium]|nr:N-6 DNA methylase [Planctomycetota bacterium]